ncbi:MAG: S-layer homology domain-containing protein, partial [Anaerovorax sp.]
MMKKNLGRKRLALLLSVAMVVTFMPNLAFADTGKEAAKTEVPAAEMAFVDMPQNWSTAALKNAVSNGLISGYDVNGKKYIKPVGNLTRAEMATIVNRGFGATEKAELKGVTDVTAKAWYAPELQKAVKMGTFKLDRLMRGDSSITRQEAFTVLARAFKVTCKDNQKALAKFTDGKAVEAYAKDAMGGLIEGGYLAGASGKLNPTGNITRAEFAKIMDSLVVQYVTKASTVTKVADKGNVMVNVPGVTLKGVTINGDLIVGDGVGTGDLNLDSVKVTGRTVVRGGGVDSIKITGTSDIQSIVVDNMNNEVRIYTAEGVTVQKVEADKAVVLDGNFTNVTVIGAGADITVSKGSKVETMTLSKSAESPKVDVQGSVGTLATAAPNTKIEVSGKVNSIAATADAKGTAVNVGKTGEATSVVTAAPNTKIEVSGTVGSIGAATGSTGTTVTANAGSKVDSITATNPKDVVSNGAGKVPPTTTAPADKPVAPPTVTEKPGETPKLDVPPVKPTPPPATGGGSGGGTDL